MRSALAFRQGVFPAQANAFRLWRSARTGGSNGCRSLAAGASLALAKCSAEAKAGASLLHSRPIVGGRRRRGTPVVQPVSAGTGFAAEEGREVVGLGVRSLASLRLSTARPGQAPCRFPSNWLRGGPGRRRASQRSQSGRAASQAWARCERTVLVLRFSRS